MIVGTAIVFDQLNFIQNKNLGFEKDQVLMIQGTNTLGDQLQVFKDELQTLSEVQSAAIGDYLPVTGTNRDGNTFWKDGRTEIDKGVGAQIWRVDSDYTETLGMKVLKGRMFSSDLASDSTAIVINQTMARKRIGIFIDNQPWVVYPKVLYISLLYPFQARLPVIFQFIGMHLARIP